MSARSRTFLLMAVVGVASVALYAACSGNGTKTCSNCTTGCCDSTGTCQPGTSASACGTGGNACTSCSGSTTCQAGACQGGNTDGGNNTDAGGGTDAGNGGTDSGTDAGQVNCSAQDAGAACTKASDCTGGTTCCLSLDAGTASCVTSGCCPSGDEVACDGPTACTGGDYCCLDVVIDGGADFLACNFLSAGTTCTASCPYNVPQESFTCAPGPDQLTLCKVGVDCSPDAGFDGGFKCCDFKFPGSNLTERVCADSEAQAGGTNCQ